MEGKIQKINFYEFKHTIYVLNLLEFLFCRSHWMLAVIKMSKTTVFWMDPLGKPIREDIKRVVGM